MSFRGVDATGKIAITGKHEPSPQRTGLRALRKPTTAKIAPIKNRKQFLLPASANLHPAVTYVHVSSLGCKYSFLGLRTFPTLCQSVDFVNILSPVRNGLGFFKPQRRGRPQRDAFGEVKAWSGEHGESDGTGGRPAKRRVAVYCRVSTLAEEQGSSYALQQSYYQRRILDDPEMELAGVYGDRGASGRSLKKRQGLQRLLEDCEAGKIDLILVKSISRFARNIKECIETIRRLRQLGIGVCFEKEGLNTLDERADLLLNILATIAEEESNSLSRNLLWRISGGTKRGALSASSLMAMPWTRGAAPGRSMKARRRGYAISLNRRRWAGRSAGSARNSTPWEARDGTGLRWTAARVSVALGNIAYKGDYLTNRTVALDCSGRRGRNRGQRISITSRATTSPSFLRMCLSACRDCAQIAC